MPGERDQQELWDPGVQIERTSLAWLRTILALVVAAMVLIRLGARHLSGLALTGSGLVLAIAALLGALAWRRYRSGTRSLHRHDPLPDGVLPLCAATATVAVGGAALTYVLTA